MRILDKTQALIGLDTLGMSEASARAASRTASGASYGAVLVTGPTGSGKSTTLYAALNEINEPQRNIITIEDPVEYQLPGVNQLQVNLKAGLTFAGGLRSMLRADPDVIMVGEIRDGETAKIAIESALTGHLVLSTLHTNDAPSAITRLTEMGIEPFLTASAVVCIVAQRLVRQLCTYCKSRDHAERVVAREGRLQRGLRPRGLRARRLRPLRRLRLQGPDRPVRGHDASPTRSATSRSSARPPTKSARSPSRRACARCARTASRRSRTASRPLPRWQGSRKPTPPADRRTSWTSTSQKS